MSTFTSKKRSNLLCTRCGIILQRRVFFCLHSFPFLPDWGSRLETEFIGLAGRGARTLPPSGSSTPHSFGSGFALENRIHWLCGDAYTNREPVDLEKTAELKNQLLLLFWRYWILTRIKERSWATVSIPVAQLLLRRGSIIPITYSSDLS